MFNVQYEIYQLLLEAKKTNPVLKYFNIYYARQVNVNSNSIYVALSEARPTGRTHTSQKYDEVIDIVITTKQNQYLEASKIHGAVVDIILNLLRTDDRYKDRLNWNTFTPRFNKTQELQLGELVISMKGTEAFNTEFVDDESWQYDIITCIKGYSDGDESCSDCPKDDL